MLPASSDAIFAGIQSITAEIFECDGTALTPSTKLMQDLPCESIDLLEIAARVSQTFHIQTDDDALFLRSLRVKVEEARGKSAPADVIRTAYPHLSALRAQELAGALADPSPLVTLGDMAAWVTWAQAK